ncbi:UNVERIFIED_CONTAM: hypothetical protein Slati_3321700 [Sesamum latifolium]|uniref:Uncharacterized protein n=1 Tax=Sesamum latifolium TaxID=2727402 RepID=A0AAW2V235_9LAMI
MDTNNINNCPSSDDVLSSLHPTPNPNPNPNPRKRRSEPSFSPSLEMTTTTMPPLPSLSPAAAESLTPPPPKSRGLAPSAVRNSGHGKPSSATCVAILSASGGASTHLQTWSANISP